MPSLTKPGKNHFEAGIEVLRIGLETRDLILMASLSVLAAHVLVLVSEVPALSTGSREPASVSRSASRPNLDGLGLGLGHPCLGLGLGGPGLDYNPDCNPGFLSGLTLFCNFRNAIALHQMKYCVQHTQK